MEENGDRGHQSLCIGIMHIGTERDFATLEIVGQLPGIMCDSFSETRRTIC